MTTTGHSYKRGVVIQQSILGGRGSHAITGVRQGNKKHDIAVQPRGSENDYSLVGPIRQTVSIFKQPVTVYKEHKSKVRFELKHVSREKPLQLYWTRRLSSLNTVNVEEGGLNNRRISLPVKKSSMVPGITDHMLLASISTNLNIFKNSTMRQQENRSLVEKNPAAHVNPGGEAEAVDGSEAPGMKLRM